MTSPGSNEIEIEVRVRDLASSAMRGIGKAGSAIGSLGKGLAALGAAGGAVQVVAGLGAALAAAAPAALVLPGVLLGAAAAGATLKLAFSGMGEAISAADPAAFAEATKDMAPAARETASAVRDLKPAFQDLKQSVQQGMFAGLAKEITETGNVLLSTLKPGLTAVSGQLNEMANQAIQAARSEFFTGDLTSIVNNTSAALGNMEGFVADLLSGFVGLGAVGSEYLPAIGQAAGNAAEKFKAWVDSGVESGRIKESIDAALDVLSQFGEVAANVGSIVGSIFSGLSGGESSNFLTGLVAITEKLDSFFASLEAQEALGALGEMFRTVSAVMGDVFLAVLQAVTPVVTALAPLVGALAETLGGILIPIIEALAPPLEIVAQALTDALLPVLPMITAAFQTLAPILAEVAMAIGEALAQAITMIAPLIPPLVQGFVDIVAAVLPLIPPLLELAMAILPILVDVFNNVVVPAIQLVATLLREILVPALIVIIEAVTEVVNFVRPAFTDLSTFIGGAVNTISAILSWFGNLPGMIREWFGGAKDAAIAKSTEMVDWLRGLPDRITGAIGNLGNLLYNAGRDILNGLWNGIQSRAASLQNQVGSFFSRVIPGWAKQALGIASPSKVFADLGQFIPAGLAEGIKDNLGEVSIASARMVGAAVGPVALPAPRAAAAAGGMFPSGGGGGEVRVVLEFVGDGDLVELLRRSVRVRGGDVQAVLGGSR